MATKQLTLTNSDMKVLVDAEDYDRIAACGNWKVHHQTGTIINKRSINGKVRTLTLPRFIISAPKGKNVLQVNGDKLDCRKENLCLSLDGPKIRTRKGSHYIDANVSRAIGLLNEIYNVVPLYKYMDDGKLVELETVLGNFLKEA